MKVILVLVASGECVAEAPKRIVFELIKGKVCTQVVMNCSAKTLLPIIRSEVNEESAVYTDGFKSYDGLVDAGYKKHYRVKHGQNEFAN